MNRKQLVIFDLDGTLLNTIDDLGHAVNSALEANGFHAHPIEAYPRMVGNGVRKLVERALPQECRSDETVQRILSHFKAYYNEHLHVFTVPYPGIPEMLRKLSAEGVALAVTSNKYESAVKALMTHFFPDIPFVATLGNVEGVPPKPDPSIVFRVLSQRPTPKADVLYCGDSAVDMETARRAGVESVGVSWGFRPVRELNGAYADHIVDSPEGIAALALGTVD